MARPRFSRRKAVALTFAASAVVGAGYIGNSYSRFLQASRQRVAKGSQVIQTRFGQLEYAIGGNAPPLMMLHGTGGGFDQGLNFAAGIIRRGYRVIAPSRFGYLRSDIPADPSSENQADALVELLDHLGINRLPVAGGSAGALSAIQFALRHPDRCAGLILLVPAANVSGPDPVQMSTLQKFMVETLSNSNFAYWAALNTIPDQLVSTLLATDPKLLVKASPEERSRAYRILDDIMPVSARSRGMLNDARLAGSPAPTDFTRIAVPTLIISVEDDRFSTAATARLIAAAVRGAKLVVYPSGGHIWLDHDGAIADEVSAFVRKLAAAKAEIG